MRIYPASGLTCCDNTPTAAFVLFISPDLDRELQRCSSLLEFLGGGEELWEPSEANGGKMSGEEAIRCPSGPGAPYIHGGQLHARPSEGTRFSQETGKP